VVQQVLKLKVNSNQLKGSVSDGTIHGHRNCNLYFNSDDNFNELGVNNGRTRIERYFRTT
jgi:hypothetical protein